MTKHTSELKTPKFVMCLVHLSGI